MIKINLIGEGKKPVAARPTKAPGAGMGGAALGSALLAGLVLLGLLVVGVQWFLLGRKVENRRAAVAAAQEEVDALAPFIKEVEEFKAKKAELERKVQVISDLKANQRGPVQIMDHISRALPELLWLTSMEVRDNAIVISGQAFNTNAVANFIENLDKVPEFQEPVLQETAHSGPIYTFTITFGYSYTTPQAAETAVAAGG